MRVTKRTIKWTDALEQREKKTEYIYCTEVQTDFVTNKIHLKTNLTVNWKKTIPKFIFFKWFRCDAEILVEIDKSLCFIVCGFGRLDFSTEIRNTAMKKLSIETHKTISQH